MFYMKSSLKGRISVQNVSEIPGFDAQIYRCYILWHEAVDFVTKCEDSTFTKAGLPYQQCVILVVMQYMKGKISLNALARRLHREPNTISSIINRMVLDGLVKRTRDRIDRRSLRLTTTDKGMEKLRRAFGPGWALITRLFTCFTNEELNTFSVLLHRLSDRAFNEIDPEGTRETMPTDIGEWLGASIYP
jgi:DNA-binding MarR family transcriptional regulator